VDIQHADEFQRLEKIKSRENIKVIYKFIVIPNL
jgi:hypothetical protein